MGKEEKPASGEKDRVRMAKSQLGKFGVYCIESGNLERRGSKDDGSEKRPRDGLERKLKKKL